MRIATFLFMIALATSWISPDLNAQELEVTPGKLMYAVNPGSSQTQQVFVRNKGNTEQSYVFNLADWLTDENGEVKYFEAGTINRSCAEWITVSPSVVSLQPNESARVNVTMLVPNDDMSTKWAMLFVESAKEQTGPKAIDKDVQMGLTVSARIALPVYQSPPGNTLYKGTIEGLAQTTADDGNMMFESQVINLGDKILNCKVYFTIMNLETAEETVSEPLEFSLLPESAKMVEFTPEKELKNGNYSVTAVLDYGFNDELEGVQLDIEVK
ncbi:MAG: WxL protein peptidoglycan domain-containing protein [Bacteroidales bacterium]